LSGKFSTPLQGKIFLYFADFAPIYNSSLLCSPQNRQESPVSPVNAPDSG
jgi:hypothetical protein